MNASLLAAAAQPIIRGSQPHSSPLSERVPGPSSDCTRRENVYFLSVGDVLGRQHFIKQMEREKLRTDRSGTPLSMILFRLDAGKADDLGGAEHMLRLLASSKRETDVLGYLREDLIALLLPDTNQEGAQGFMGKVKTRLEKFGITTVTGTYPDQLFEQILTEPKTLANLSPFYVARSRYRGNPGYPLKRIIDILGAALGIVLLSPLMLITAVAVALDSPGPIFFRQLRLGKGGIPFVFYKFRSMYANADDRIHREFVSKLISGRLNEVNQGDSSKPHYKIKSDPRVTRVGRIIRSTSIDELPQLLNVLKGDMSLVGPRPPLPYEVENYESWHLTRILEIKPGITGLWQVEGHSSTTFDEMVRLDLRYIRKCSLLVDLKILFKTTKALLQHSAT